MKKIRSSPRIDHKRPIFIVSIAMHNNNMSQDGLKLTVPIIANSSWISSDSCDVASGVSNQGVQQYQSESLARPFHQFSLVVLIGKKTDEH